MLRIIKKSVVLLVCLLSGTKLSGTKLHIRILHISWHDFVSNDEVLSRTGLFDVSYIVRKRRLGLFGHVARLRSDVPANQILRICTKTRDGDRPSQEWRRASGRPPTTWIHQICRDTGVTATEALQLAEDRPFWRTIATAGGFGWSLRVTTTTTTTTTTSSAIESTWPLPLPWQHIVVACHQNIRRAALTRERTAWRSTRRFRRALDAGRDTWNEPGHSAHLAGRSAVRDTRAHSLSSRGMMSVDFPAVTRTTLPTRSTSAPCTSRSLLRITLAST